MIRITIATTAILYSQWASAGLLDIFRLEDGHTNWQYVANTSGTVLIVALSYSIIRLIRSHREAQRYNQELEEARNQLEQRVQERTATLDESNRLLQKSNLGLEDEISEHRATTEQLGRSESYINSILSSMPSMLIGLTHDGTITQWNDAAQQVSGLSTEEAIGNNLWQAYPVITVAPDQIQAALRDNKTITVKQSQRGQYYFDVTIYPLLDQAETGVVVMIDDVTQRVLAENKLIQRDKMSSMGELAASMAYDISAPLHGIVTAIEALQGQLEGQDPALILAASELLEEARLRGQQGFAVINNLLSFSSAQSGNRQTADVTQVIDHSLALANTMLSIPGGANFSDIRVERRYAKALPQVPCFPAELQQVFLSLFRHCCHALGQAERTSYIPTITIEVDHFYEALWIKVQHNGRGISLEEQQYIFEPFFADTSNSSNDDYEDGWRLSYPHFIITEQHRGQLAVTSDIVIGTTFHIQLLLQ